MPGLSARTKTTALMIVTVVLLIVDRFLKQLALHFYSTKIIIKNILSFSLSENTGIAFSLGAEKNLSWLILLITLILLFVAYKKMKSKEYVLMASLLLIIIGSASNLFDRFAYGAVIDYFYFLQITIFNLADLSIILGATLYIINSKMSTLDRSKD